MSATRYRLTIEFSAEDITAEQVDQLVAAAEVQICEPVIADADGNDVCEGRTIIHETTIEEV